MAGPDRDSDVGRHRPPILPLEQLDHAVRHNVLILLPVRHSDGRADRNVFLGFGHFQPLIHFTAFGALWPSERRQQDKHQAECKSTNHTLHGNLPPTLRCRALGSTDGCCRVSPLPMQPHRPVIHKCMETFTPHRIEGSLWTVTSAKSLIVAQVHRLRRAILSSRRMRSSIGGWVETSCISLPPLSGLTINRCRGRRISLQR